MTFKFMIRQGIVGLVILLTTAVGAEEPKDTPPAALTLNAKVVFLSLEKGFYGLKTETGAHYVPMNLPKMLQQDGLWVTLKAEKVNDKKGIHMWGEYIRIVEIAVNPCLNTQI